MCRWIPTSRSGLGRGAGRTILSWRQLEAIDSFVSVERFEGLSEPGKLLSLSFWRDEATLADRRNLAAHRATQSSGRREVFAQYRLRVAA